MKTINAIIDIFLQIIIIIFIWIGSIIGYCSEAVVLGFEFGAKACHKKVEECIEKANKYKN